MMKNKIFSLFLLCGTLAACGYKGDLYLPRENDKARFGVIQTGIDFRKPDATLRKQHSKTLDTNAASAAEGIE